MQRGFTPTVVRRIEWDRSKFAPEDLLDREWIVTNGLGGYASGSLAGAVTRRYHGLLIAALAAPLGRVVMWNHLTDSLRFDDGQLFSLSAEERAGSQSHLAVAEYLREFRLEDGLPVWVFQVRDVVLEKRILLPHLQNTVHISYRILQGDSKVQLELRPAFHFRHHEIPVNKGKVGPYRLTAVDSRFEIAPQRPGFPILRMKLYGSDSAFTIAAANFPQVVYRVEQSRGYASEGDLWSPGFFHLHLAPNETATLVGSTEKWEIVEVLNPPQLLSAERERRGRLLHRTDKQAETGFGAE
jgi:predicted glycogen debranching enzyme